MIDKLLGKLNAEIVIQVCGNFALANELGELPTELNQERADKHHAILAKYKSQLLAEILKGKETFEIPEYEQGILEAIPTQYLKELFKEIE